MSTQHCLVELNSAGNLWRLSGNLSLPFLELFWKLKGNLE